jgi:adenylosuccinate lyase
LLRDALAPNTSTLEKVALWNEHDISHSSAERGIAPHGRSEPASLCAYLKILNRDGKSPI